MSVDLSKYKVGVVETVQGVGKSLKACIVNVGSNNSIRIVTSATNVREGSRLVVAPVGSTFLDEEGSIQTVKRIAVGGVMSDGMFCDSYMLGWVGGAKGIAAQIPEEYEIGSAPPSTKPHRRGEAVDEPSTTPISVSQGLFEKKLSKEEKKKIAEERRKSRKAAKASKSLDGINTIQMDENDNRQHDNDDEKDDLST